MSMGTRAVFDPDEAAPAPASPAALPEPFVTGNVFSLSKKSRDELRAILTRAGGKTGVENFIDQMVVLCRDAYRGTYVDSRTAAQQVNDLLVRMAVAIVDDDARFQPITGGGVRVFYGCGKRGGGERRPAGYFFAAKMNFAYCDLWCEAALRWMTWLLTARSRAEL